MPTVPKPDLHLPALYLNRELSQLEFIDRVLAQARDPAVPLLERLRFLCISCTNLDEFFEVRVASVRHSLEFGTPPGADGMGPSEALERIHERASRLVNDQYSYWNDVLRPELADAGIRFLPRESWNEAQRKWLKRHFSNAILPVLTPLGLDPSHPFPRILNKSLNIVVVLDGRDAFGRAGKLAIVRAPRSLPRVIQLPKRVSGGAHDFVLLSAVLSSFADELFPGMTVKGAYQFRVTRNSELAVDEDDVENLAHALKGELVDRGFAGAVRLEIAAECPPHIVKALLKNFELQPSAVYRIHGPVNVNRVSAVYDLVGRPDLKYPPFTQGLERGLIGPSIFDRLRRGDVLLHHPFDSFAPVVELVRTAAHDPAVLAIKQTLYRTGVDSSFVVALIEAARNGKDVTVVIELRARFDEAANIEFADRLQHAGVQVVYGVVGFKAHAKMLLIVRREGRSLKRYTHLATGNYHSGTAKAYTDIGLLTADPAIGHDVHQIFLQLSGLAPAIKLKRLLQSPFTLHAELLRLIEREAKHARSGRGGRVIARMNALNEPTVIRALYAASQVGCQIDLIVRGACALRPGVPGISENIRVRSIVGRFLEHSRVYWFGNAGKPLTLAASADWLERNLRHRVEVAFPIRDPELANRILDETLTLYLEDNVDAWCLGQDGRYRRVERPAAEPPISAQQTLLARRAA